MTTLTHYQKYQTTPEAKESAHYRHIKACYGINKEEYLQLNESQGGACAICGTTEVPEERRGRLSVDHEHNPATDWERGTRDKTTIRGLLCQPCNKGLGAFKDDPTLLTKAIAYLSKPKPFSQS